MHGIDDPLTPEFTTKAEALRARYAAVEVPEQLHTGELEADPLFSSAKNEFIAATADALRLGRAATTLLTLQRFMLLPHDRVYGLPANQQQYMSEDYITRLDLDGVQPLITIMQSRTDFNYMVVQYTKHELGENAMRRIVRYSEDAQ